MTEILFAAGWTLAALFAGLYLGERGRRLDAQLREGVLPVGRTKRATVRERSDAPEPDGALIEARQCYVEAAVREGFNPDEAAADFDRMMAQVNTDRPVAWDPSV